MSLDHAHQGRSRGTSGSNPKDVLEVGSTIQRYRMLRDAHPLKALLGHGDHGTRSGNRITRDLGRHKKKRKSVPCSDLNLLGGRHARKKTNALLHGRNLVGRRVLLPLPRHALPHTANGMSALRAAGNSGRKAWSCSFDMPDDNRRQCRCNIHRS